MNKLELKRDVADRILARQHEIKFGRLLPQPVSKNMVIGGHGKFDFKKM